MVLFFGRPTLGPLMRLLPGSGDLFLRRFISGVHLAGLYLTGLGLTSRWSHLADRALRRLTAAPSAVPVVAVAVAALLLVVPAMMERIRFERQGGRWIDQQTQAQATDGLGYQALVERAAEPRARAASSPELRGPRVASYRIGQVPAYAALLNLQADAWASRGRPGR